LINHDGGTSEAVSVVPADPSSATAAAPGESAKAKADLRHQGEDFCNPRLGGGIPRLEHFGRTEPRYGRGTDGFSDALADPARNATDRNGAHTDSDAIGAVSGHPSRGYEVYRARDCRRVPHRAVVRCSAPSHQVTDR